MEHFCDKNAVIAVVDFGRFHLSTQDSYRVETQAPPPLITTTRDSDDEEGNLIHSISAEYWKLGDIYSASI